MITRGIRKKTLGSYLHALVTFSLMFRFDLRSIALAPEAIKEKNYCFSRRWFFIINFLIIEIRKQKCTIVFSSSKRFEKCIFWPRKAYFRIWLMSGQVRSGQGQVMTQYAYLPNQIDEHSRLAPFACLYIYPVTSYWRLNILWPHVTSDDLPVTHDHQMHPCHHRWGE